MRLYPQWVVRGLRYSTFRASTGRTRSSAMLLVRRHARLPGRQWRYARLPGRQRRHRPFAAAVISALPAVIAFLLCQRWFLDAIAGSGLDHDAHS
jgi:hypothetical protein